MRTLFLAALVATAAAAFPSAAVAQTRVLVCESKDHRSYACPIGSHRRVELVRRLSDTRCKEGRNWWVRDDRIVVAGGCRAEFAVYGGWGRDDRGRRHDRHDDDRHDRYDDDRDDRYDDRRDRYDD